LGAIFEFFSSKPTSPQADFGRSYPVESARNVINKLDHLKISFCRLSAFGFQTLVADTSFVKKQNPLFVDWLTVQACGVVVSLVTYNLRRDLKFNIMVDN